MNIHSFGSVMKKRVAVPLPAFIILCLFAVIVPFMCCYAAYLFSEGQALSPTKSHTETFM